MGSSSSCADPGSAAGSTCILSYGDCVGNQMTIECEETDPTSFGCGTKYIASIIDIPSLIIPDGHTVDDVNVYVRLNHVYMGDVEGGVFHNNGDGKKLFDPAGTTCQGDHMDAWFDDSGNRDVIEAGTNCDSGLPTAFGGIHKSKDSLSYFNGENANGQWKLEVQDSVQNDDGIFYGWGIELNIPSFCTDAPTPAPTTNPTRNPTKKPTISPTKNPTITPSITPTKFPTKTPSLSPSNNPSQTPSKFPSKTPSLFPSLYPSKTPSYSPSLNPSMRPSQTPTLENAVGFDTSATIGSNGYGSDQKGSNSLNNGDLMSQYTIIIALSSLLLLIFCCLIIACVCIYRKRHSKNKDNKTNKMEMERVTSVASEPGMMTSVDSNGIAGEGDIEDTTGTGTNSNENENNNENDMSNPVIDGTQYTNANYNMYGGTGMNNNGMNNNMNMMNQMQMMNQMNAQMNMMQNLQMTQPLPQSQRMLIYNNESNENIAIVPSENYAIGPFVHMGKRNTAGNITAGNINNDNGNDLDDEDTDEDQNNNGLYGRNDVAQTKH